MKTPSTSRLARPASLAGFALLALVTFGLAAPSPARVPGGLQGRWKFDEGTGTSSADSSGTGNTGTLNGGVSWTSGRSGNALSFDGSSGYVTAGTTGMPANNAAQTVSWWMNLSSIPSGVACAIDLHNDASSSAVQTGFHSGRLTVWKNGGGVLVDAAAPSTGVWHHVAYTYDGTTHKLFLDGAQVSSSTAAAQTAAVTSLTFGRWNGGAQEYFAGKLDEIRIYSRTLTTAEVVGLAHDPALEGLWLLDEGSGTATSDTSGMGHDGTLNNGTAWTTGQSGNALSLDGTDDTVSLSLETGLPAANGLQTVAWRMNYASVPSSIQAVVCLTNSASSSAVQCGFRNGVITAWNWGGTTIVSATAPSTNTWHHFAYTFDGTTHTLYIDGTSVNTSTVTAQTAAPSRLDFGFTPGWAEYYAGKLDEVRIYSRTLSATEVAGLAGGSGTGLSAVYYDNMDFTGTFVQRTDATINFNWGTGSPDASIGADTFSALWTGQVQPQYTETYTFYTNTDDGARLSVNGQLLIDFPQDMAVTEKSGSITLNGGQKYDLRMEYTENGGLAQAELRWSSPSTPKAIIPQSQLYPTDSVTPTLLNATASSSALTTVYLRFNEAMHAAAATTTGNYTLSGGLTVSGAAISADKKVVTLTTSAAVTIGTTTVTANNLKNLEQETMASATKTIVAGNSQGIPDSIAVTLVLSTDSNKSCLLQGSGASFGTPQSNGEELTVTAPGTTATTIELIQIKAVGGTSQITFGASGTDTSLVVTTSGGSPNQAVLNVRHATTGAFKDDFRIVARVSGEDRGVKAATAISASITPGCSLLSDQRPTNQTLQTTPAIEGLNFVGKAYLIDFGKTDISKETTLFAPPAFPATDSTGKTTRVLHPCGVQVYGYFCIALADKSGFTYVDMKEENYNHYKKGPEGEQSLSSNDDMICTYASYQDSVDPVDIIVGEKKIGVNDLIIRGRGMDYVFRRKYTSYDYRQTMADMGAPVVRDFGVGWRYSYADEYLIKDGTGSEDTSNYVNFRDGNSGSVLTNIGSGKWGTSIDRAAQLRKNPNTGDFELRDQMGDVRVYHNFQTATTPNKNGRLKEIRDRNGNRMAFFYEQIDPDNTVSGDEKMVLAYVIDSMGREIRYRYYAKTAQTVSGRQVTEATTNAGAIGRLYHIRDFKGNMDFDGTENPDFSGQDANRQVRFDYDAEGNLVMARSPIVKSGSTPNGNDFPNGRTTRYKYILEGDLSTLVSGWGSLTNAQKDVVRRQLLHKMTHVWRPNEVRESLSTNPADSEAAEILTYGTGVTFSPASSTLIAQPTYLGFVTSYTVGGTNGNGVPSGGTINYTITDLNVNRGMPAFPHNTYIVQSLKVQVTDRNSNQAEYLISGAKTIMEYKELPKALRSGEPSDYKIKYNYTGGGDDSGNGADREGDRLLSKRTMPEGDTYENTYNINSPDRFQQGNKIRNIRRPDVTRGGDQSTIETVMVYEPIYNRPCLIVSARGSNSSANGFTPPIAEPGGHSRTMTDPYDATKTLNLRYAVIEFFDFQESPEKASAAPASRKDKDGSGGQVNASPLISVDANVLTTEVWLVQILGLPEDSTGLNELRTRLSNNLTKLGLGDLNGDGDTTPAAAGNIIRTAFGSPVLLAGTNQAAIESAIDGSDLIDQSKTPDQGGTMEGSQGARLQTIVFMFQYNAFGQVTKTISPEGNVSTYTYFPENDADGDSITTPAPADGRTLDTVTGGYLKETLRDTTRSYIQQTTGTSLSGAISNNNTNPAVTDIKVSYTYDDVGNPVTMTNGRGIRTDFFVTELDETIQTTRAADVSGAASANPSDPLYNHSDTQQKLTAFAYKSRTFLDYNGNVVLSQTEDRGNTSSVDGSGLGTLPSQATGTTPGLSAADPSGGDAYVDHLSLFDRLDNQIESRAEVDSTRSLNTRYRYDGNQHQVLVIHPEGNAESTIYDERDLVFQRVRGASSRPSAGKYASGDPTTFDRPGGSGTTPSATTYNYDKDMNLVEVVDAADTDSNSANNSTIAGAGDVVAKVTYDGYNRRKTVTDALGNKTTFVYDPDSNVARVIQDGDPVDDVVGSSENKTLAVTETIHDELGRAYVVHRVLFQTPDASPTRTPTLSDTPAMDSLAAYLADASSDTASVPAATGITVIGRVTSITEYDRESRVTFRLQDDLDVHRIDYDGAGRGVKTTDDAFSNGFSGGAYTPASISGNTVETAYDDTSNVIEVKETDVTTVANVSAEIFRTTLLYDSLNRLQTSFDNLGQAADLRTDSRGNSVARADAVGPVSTRSFNRRGLGSTSAVTINTFGNVTRSTFDGLSRILETEVRLTSSGQGDGTNIGATLEGVKTTAPTVDTAQSGDGLVSVYYAYDDNSQLLGLRDDDGNVTGYHYDNQNRQKVERKGLGVTGTTFSLSGGDSGAFNVALRGGVTPVDSESAGTDITRTFDPDLNVTTLVDEAGNSFACTYDALNRKKACAITKASGFIGTSNQTWKYDGLSRQGECTDDNDTGTSDDMTCRYFYDSLSRPVEESQQIGSASVRAYSCGYELDCACGGPAAGLPSECTYPDGRKLHNLYDRLDRLVSRNDVEGTTEYSNIATYQYIGRGRVAVLTYQNNIRLTHIGQVSSQNADVGFDGLRRIVNHRWESFTTQALGFGTLVMGFEHQDGNSTPAPMYDRANNKRIEYKTHDPTNSEQYKYDSAYRLTSTGSGSQGQDARGFERGLFTNANRTSMAGGVSFFQDWDLEGLGNWSRQDDNARVETRNHSDFNEIDTRTVSGNNAALTHDKNGNTTDTGYTSLGGQNFPGGGLRLEWDGQNRLRKVYKNTNTPGSTGDDVLVAEYIYDCHNRRMQKVVTNSGSLNGTTRFYYQGWRVMEERDGSEALLQQYTYGNYLDEVWTLDNRRSSAPLSWLNDNTGVYRHYYLSNTLYHVYGLTNEGSSTTPGTLKEAYQYDAYGKQTVITDGNDSDAIVNFTSNDVRTAGGASTINGSSYTFTGQRYDSESEILYFKNRYYVPLLGRFASRDPSGNTRSQPWKWRYNTQHLPRLVIIEENLYEGILSRPNNAVDPLGLTLQFPNDSEQPYFKSLMNQLCPEGKFEISWWDNAYSSVEGFCETTTDYTMIRRNPCSGKPEFVTNIRGCTFVYHRRVSCCCLCDAISSSREFEVYKRKEPGGSTTGTVGSNPQIYVGPGRPEGYAGSGDTSAPGGDATRVRSLDWIIFAHELCGHAVARHSTMNTPSDAGMSVPIENQIRNEHSGRNNDYGQRSGTDHAR